MPHRAVARPRPPGEDRRDAVRTNCPLEETRPTRGTRTCQTPHCTADQLAPDLVFRDPYFLEFLGLHDADSEKDLEAAILRESEAFLLEHGGGFTFVARQMRMVIDGEDFALDPHFYHRQLRRLIAIDLQLGKFEAAIKGQMELGLRWLDKHGKEPGEESPLGILLCAAAGAEHVELLFLGASGIRVATYLTELPSKAIDKQKHRAAAERARTRLTDIN